jgi:hypothetical protein
MIVKTSSIPWLPFHFEEKSKTILEIDFTLRIHTGINSWRSGDKATSSVKSAFSGTGTIVPPSDHIVGRNLQTITFLFAAP